MRGRIIYFANKSIFYNKPNLSAPNGKGSRTREYNWTRDKVNGDQMTAILCIVRPNLNWFVSNWNIWNHLSCLVCFFQTRATNWPLLCLSVCLVSKWENGATDTSIGTSSISMRAPEWILPNLRKLMNVRRFHDKSLFGKSPFIFRGGRRIVVPGARSKPLRKFANNSSFPTWFHFFSPLFY